ncbi:MAG: c-type cytochrome [Caldimonas sp.]
MKKTLFALSTAAIVALSSAAPAVAQEAKAGDKAAGAIKSDLCAGCHSIPGYQASFPEVYKVPKIAGQSEKYLAAALVAYRKGERKFPTMRAIAAALSDQDIADLATYYSQLGGAESPLPAKPEHAPSPEVAKLLAQANCASCHGENFSKPIDPSYPKLAGQHGDYLYAALKAYQTDNNPRIGRSNPIMMGMARPFTHAEIKALAGYLASLPGELQTIPQPRFR